MKIYIIQHDRWITPGEYLRWAERNGHDVRMIRRCDFNPLPEDTADMLVILGGIMCPDTTSDEVEWFDAEAEMECIRQHSAEGRIVIGACLGAQLMGDALGAPYGKSPEREVGPVMVHLTEEGREDPLLRDFPDEFFGGEWHNDMPGLTEDSVILAYSEGCPRQIVRYGEYLYGFQTHMEFDRDIVAAGIANSGGSLHHEGRFVQTEEQLLAFDYSGMNGLLSGFLDRIAADYLSGK